jgi:hypothetical protein
MPTARDVAEWMLQEVIFRELDQDYAAHNIQRIFGGEFVYENANGNWAINRNVLKEFRKITGDTVVWERNSRRWRKRGTYDKPGRQQD